MTTRIALLWSMALILGLAVPGWAADLPGLPDDGSGTPAGDTRHPVVTLGPQPQLTILLRYHDIPGTQEPASYFETMMTSYAYPGLNNFLDTVSYGNANVDSSTVLGWYTLPGDWDYYNWPFDDWEYPRLDIDRVLADILPVVDPIVHLPTYKNIVLIFNAEHGCGDHPPQDCGIFSGTVGRRLDLDGVSKEYGIEFFGPVNSCDQASIAHEMMHSFGCHHSGPLHDGYPPSHWDVTTGSGTCIPPDPVFGCMAVYPNAWKMLHLGWMPEVRSFDTGASRAGIIKIEKLALPDVAMGTFGMAELRVDGSSTLSITVEYRYPVGWDLAGPIPGQAVVLHKVDTTLEDLVCEVVDPDGDWDPNDDSAMWIPGETYYDGVYHTVVHVESWNSNYATVAVSNQARSVVWVSGSASGYEDGTYTSPWNTVKEGYASATPGGNISIVPGTYGETMTISKPCQLTRGASFGIVVIGN